MSLDLTMKIEYTIQTVGEGPYLNQQADKHYKKEVSHTSEIYFMGLLKKEC
jgi:hypothetical protein